LHMVMRNPAFPPQTVHLAIISPQKGQNVDRVRA
jgi:hypothetical protein